MKKLFAICLGVFFSTAVQVYAQYGYGIDVPSKAAVLHLNASNKGLLVSRVSLLNTQTFLQNQLAYDSFSVNSLLVYNLSSQNDVTPGFYYWTTDGTTGKWNRLITESETVEPWQVQGTMDKATENTQNIYQTGTVVIGKDTTATNVLLDVAGALRVGELSAEFVGNHSIGAGFKTEASGEYSSAFGHSTKATQMYAFAAGRDTEAYGYGATSFGRESRAHGNYSFAAGERAVAGTLREAVLGGFNVLLEGNSTTWNETDPILQIGIGTSPIAANRRNALTILKNGKVGLGNFATNNNVKPQEMLHIGTGDMLKHKVRIEDLPRTEGTIADSIVVVDSDGILKSIKPSTLKSNGPWYKQGSSQTTTDNNENIYQQGAVAIGKDAGIDNVSLDVLGSARIGTANAIESIGQYSFAGGQNVIASGNNTFSYGTGAKSTGNNSIAVGNQSEASNSNSVAFGNNTLANGSAATALGFSTEASGSYSFASGNRTEAAGNNAVAFGENTYAHSRSEFVIGRYNEVVTGNKTGWTLSNSIFQVGIGTDVNNRKNAITVRKNGWVGIGATAPTGNELLSVEGSIQTASNFYPDYVFEKYYTGKSYDNPRYRFLSLSEVKKFAETNGHLPNIPKATELNRTENGNYVFNLTHLAIQSLEKIEELFLHLIEQEEKLEEQTLKLASQEEKIQELKERLDTLEKLLKRD